MIKKISYPHAMRSPALVVVVISAGLLGGSAAMADPKKEQAAPARAAAPAAHPAAGAPAGQARPGAAGAAHPGTAGGAPGRAPITTANPHGGTAAGGRPGAPGAPGAGAKPPPTAFGGHPAPAGAHVAQASNGAFVRSRPDGSRSDVHDAARGMDIHRSLNGSRQVVVERADHSRVYANSRGGGYVQRPYSYHGHEFGHRTYYDHGRAYDRYYQRYPYYGHYYDVYAPYRYYPYGYYGWAYNPWAEPVPYAWGWAGNPWYGYYGYYYAPAPVYVSSSYWLAEFMLAASLQAAYAARVVGQSDYPYPNGFVTGLATNVLNLLISPSDAAEAGGPTTLTPEVKAMLASELQLAIQQEGEQAKSNSQSQDADTSSTNVFHLLGDGKAHVFVAGQDLDLVQGTGQECAVTPGDILQVSGVPASDATTVPATVLASKGDKECPASASVSLTLSDLQEMHNHLRSSLDEGLAELQSKQGKGGLPAAPADAAAPPVTAGYAASAPPADPNAAAAIQTQLSEADRAEQEATAGVAAAPAGGGGATPTIAMGQSIAQVTAALGAPARIIDLGAKKTYVYSDMKVIFVNGAVADVQ